MSANMKAVKLRIKSVQNTMQITKAMELVASSKLRKAKERAENCRPYFLALHEALKNLAAENTDLSSVYAKENGSNKWCYVLIAGDRGLAGGYNSNVFKHLEETVKGKEYLVLPIGKKSAEYAKKNHLECISQDFEELDGLSTGDCFLISELLCREYEKGTFGHLEVCYTKFVSMLSQRSDDLSILPLSDLKEEKKQQKKSRSVILYEPDAEQVFEKIVPEYVAGLLYGAICESSVSELAARRTAMEAATSNAGEMIEKLNLHYNRARQASITQEITEIVGGAESV